VKIEGKRRGDREIGIDRGKQTRLIGIKRETELEREREMVTLVA